MIWKLKEVIIIVMKVYWIYKRKEVVKVKSGVKIVKRRKKKRSINECGNVKNKVMGY
jgi:hypothetical protein